MRESLREGIFTHIKRILAHYGLPSIFELFDKPSIKAVWKCTLNHKIHEMVETFWKSDIESKSATKYLNPGVLKIGSSKSLYMVHSKR